MIKQKPLHVYDKFKSLALGSVGLSTITVSELTYGVTKSSNPEKNRDALEQFFFNFNIYTSFINSTALISIEFSFSRLFIGVNGLWDLSFEAAVESSAYN